MKKKNINMILSKLARCVTREHVRYVNTNKQPFPVLADTKAKFQFGLTNAKARADELLHQLAKVNSVCQAGGGDKGRRLHVEKNRKVLPRERVQSLFDDGEFLELSLQAGLGMDYGDIPGASIISGIGKVNDRYCMVTANDATLKGGTYFPISGIKARRAQDIATLTFLPHIYIVDSGGGFLPLQSDIFPDKNHGGRGFYAEAVCGAQNMPQLAIVCGSSTAGGAYVPVMCDEAVIVDRVGTIFLAGPPLVKAATGEVVSSEELGGATMHCSTSGCTDYFATTEQEGFETLRELCATLDIEPESPFLIDNELPKYDPKDLDVINGLSHYDRDGILLILSRLLDGSRLREFKQKYGENLICGYGHIDGYRVGVVGNSGPLTSKDALKGSQFIQTCEMRRIPMLFLQNSGAAEAHSEFLGTLSAAERGVTLKNRAAMISALACATTARLVVNVGGCIGDDLYTMCGPSYDPHFYFVWPGTKCQQMPMHISTDPQLLQTPQNKQKSGIGKSAFNFPDTDAMYWAAHCLNDGIIIPSETRQILVRCMRIFAQKRRLKEDPKKFPMLRF